jgi:hypothetical protein
MRRNLARAAVLGCALAGLIAAAGCSSGSGSAPESSWASSLGSGVTVQAPAQVSAGTGSPAAAVQGVITAVSSGQYALECNYVEPSEQATCKTGAAAFNASDSPSFKNVQMGYVATDGAQALVGATGTFCVPNANPECYTNNDPAAIFSTKKSFSTLWTQTNSSSSSNTNAYALVPCVEVSGHWYVYSPSS